MRMNNFAEEGVSIRHFDEASPYVRKTSSVRSKGHYLGKAEMIMNICVNWTKDSKKKRLVWGITQSLGAPPCLPVGPSCVMHFVSRNHLSWTSSLETALGGRNLVFKKEGTRSLSFTEIYVCMTECAWMGSKGRVRTLINSHVRLGAERPSPQGSQLFTRFRVRDFLARLKASPQGWAARGDPEEESRMPAVVAFARMMWILVITVIIIAMVIIIIHP